jgi:uncharacterized protein (DUF1330 family)
LYGRSPAGEGFRDYEKKALGIFRRHGGEVIVAYAPLALPGQRDLPDEIQVLRIADRAGFEAFLADPERARLSGERDRVIRKSEVFLSGEIVAYG